MHDSVNHAKKSFPIKSKYTQTDALNFSTYLYYAAYHLAALCSKLRL
jgi:hypothetical protein